MLEAEAPLPRSTWLKTRLTSTVKASEYVERPLATVVPTRLAVLMLTNARPEAVARKPVVLTVYSCIDKGRKIKAVPLCSGD